MRVDPNREPLGVAVRRVDETRCREPVRRPDHEPPTQGAGLAHALRQIPEVRVGKVAAARAMIQDPAYPSDGVLGKVAALLADHLEDSMKPE